MRYYKLENGCDNKEVGSQYPQVWDFIKGYSPKNEDNGVYSLYYDYNPLFPLVEPNLSGFKLASGAKYTDFLSSGFGNELFFLNENAKRFMEDQNLDVHRFYKGKVTSLRKKIVEDYYVMKLVSENWQYLDFPNCEFYISDADTDDIIPVEIGSSEEFIKKWTEFLADEEDYHIIYSRTIKMTEAFYKKKLDLFMLDKCNHDWFVSERFVEEYNKRRLTGLEFEPVDI
jgi:hypothetical protein